MAEIDPPEEDFFISYNKADRGWAEWIAWHLEETGGYSVAIQAVGIRNQLQLALEMDRAIEECDRVLAVSRQITWLHCSRGRSGRRISRKTLPASSGKFCRLGCASTR